MDLLPLTSLNVHVVSSNAHTITSFPLPVFDYLQYANTMGEWGVGGGGGGGGGGIWSQVVPSGRQMADRCPMKNLDALSYTVRPKAGCQSVRKADEQCHLLFIMPETDQCETGIRMVEKSAPPPPPPPPPPPCVYPLST